MHDKFVIAMLTMLYTLLWASTIMPTRKVIRTIGVGYFHEKIFECILIFKGTI